MNDWKNSPKTILITDDHSVIRNTLREWLCEEIPGLNVIEASSGEIALSLLNARNLPDLIVMDFHLPGMSGLETIREIKDAHPQIPVIMLTIQEDRQYIVRAEDEGADGYVIKRNMYTDLLPAIKEVFNGQP